MSQFEIKSRSDLHLWRKLWHVSAVLTMFFIYRYATDTQSLVALLLGTLLFVPIDLLRQNQPALNHHVMRWFRPIIRQHEVNSLAGTTYLIAGAFILFLFVPKNVAELTLLFLAVGDPIASLIGITLGRDKLWRDKTLQGTLGAIVVCSLLAGVFYYVEGLMLERLFLVSLLSGSIGAICELIPVGTLDDNLTFPVLCSMGLWSIYYLFGAL